MALPRTSNLQGQDVINDMLASGGAPRDMAPIQIVAVRDYLNSSLYAFCKLIFDYQDLDPHLHGEVCAFISKWDHDNGLWGGTDGWPRLMLQIPREAFKTSVATRANSLWQVCRWFFSEEKPDATVAIFNEREANSQKWLRNIRDVVAGSDIFREVYRDLLPPGVYEGKNPPQRWKWSDNELQFQKKSHGQSEASITGLGVTSATTGGHWTHLIKDDILSFEASRSETVMQMVKDWCDAARDLERPGRDGLDLFACTPWHYNDAYRYVLEQYGDEYRVLRRSALELNPETGKEESIFPSKWSARFLQKERKRNPYHFNAQMQCKPMAGKEMSFNENWLRFGSINAARTDDDFFEIRQGHYNPSIIAPGLPDGDAPQRCPLAWMDKCLILDPAPSEQTDVNREGDSARNALVLVAMDPWGRSYLLDVWAGRDDVLDILRRIFRTLKLWGCHKFACEHVNFSKLYKPFFDFVKRAEFRDVHVSYTPLKPGRTDKNTRILSMTPSYRSGLWYWTDSAIASAIREFVEYPHSATMDILDALSYADQVLKRPESPMEYEQRLVDRQVQDYGQPTYDELTGY